MDDILNEFRRFAADRLEQIHHRVPGAVLTLIARTPGKPDMDIVITADADPGAVVDLLFRRFGERLATWEDPRIGDR